MERRTLLSYLAFIPFVGVPVTSIAKESSTLIDKELPQRSWYYNKEVHYWHFEVPENKENSSDFLASLENSAMRAELNYCNMNRFGTQTWHMSPETRDTLSNLKANEGYLYFPSISLMNDEWRLKKIVLHEGYGNKITLKVAFMGGVRFFENDVVE